MIAGDGNGDSYIDDMDVLSQWSIVAGGNGYYLGDFNLNGQINNQDKNDIWLPNYGKSIIFPE